MNRYTRQIILPNFGTEGQQRLQESKVLVVGAGGLGVPVLQYLTAAGVGEIGIVDGDVVSLTNLHRQVLYQEADLGKLKSDVAGERLGKMNAAIKIVTYSTYLDISNVFEIIPAYDIIVDCTDNFATRYLANDVCCLYKIPLVFASIFQFEFQISVFHYGENPANLRDVFPDIPDEKTVPNCNEAGVLGTVAGIAGTIQANEVIKIITGNDGVLAGKILVMNTRNYHTLVLSIRKNNDVFQPQSKEEILQKDYGFVCINYFNIETNDELQHLVDQENSVLIDVRECNELPRILNLPVKEIPLSEISHQAEMYKDKAVVILLCQTGVRSKKAIEVLTKQYPDKRYFNVVNGMHIFET